MGPMKEEQQEEHTAAALLAAIITHTACTSNAVLKRTCMRGDNVKTHTLVPECNAGFIIGGHTAPVTIPFGNILSCSYCLSGLIQ